MPAVEVNGTKINYLQLESDVGPDRCVNRISLIVRYSTSSPMVEAAVRSLSGLKDFS